MFRKRLRKCCEKIKSKQRKKLEKVKKCKVNSLCYRQRVLNLPGWVNFLRPETRADNERNWFIEVCQKNELIEITLEEI